MRWTEKNRVHCVYRKDDYEEHHSLLRAGGRKALELSGGLLPHQHAARLGDREHFHHPPPRCGYGRVPLDGTGVEHQRVRRGVEGSSQHDRSHVISIQESLIPEAVLFGGSV